MPSNFEPTGLSLSPKSRCGAERGNGDGGEHGAGDQGGALHGSHSSAGGPGWCLHLAGSPGSGTSGSRPFLDSRSVDAVDVRLPYAGATMTAPATHSGTE